MSERRDIREVRLPDPNLHGLVKESEDRSGINVILVQLQNVTPCGQKPANAPPPAKGSTQKK